GMVHPHNGTLEIDLSAQESSEYNVTFSDREFKLSSTGLTSTPEGSGWYYLGDGKYTGTRNVSVRVQISRYRDSNILTIPVELTAKPVSGSDRGVSSRVLRVRTFDFRAVLSPSLIPQSRENKGREQQGEGIMWGGKQGDEVKFRENELEFKEGGENRLKKNKSFENPAEKKKTGVGLTTIVLLGGIMASLAYIFRVI
ncbi:MAG: hypothetical protein ABEJ72_01310, partial [Candidatus Aenigmatarchaeota archaeon]